MRLNRLLPALLLLPLVTGCSYSRMPDWLVRMVGGPERSGKYVDGPLKEAYVVERAKLKLPPLTQDGAIRLQVAPSFGLYDYVLDFTPQPAGCLMWWQDQNLSDAEMKRTCKIVAVHVWRSASQSDTVPGMVDHRKFYVPLDDYTDAIESFNDRVSDWRGGRSAILDGTGLNLEHSYQGKIGSMIANAGERPSENPLSQFARDIHRVVLAYGPTGFFPQNARWRNRYDPDYPCNGGLAGTDPDGMGAGDDACAAKLRARPR